jgi:hypothetical protein
MCYLSVMRIGERELKHWIQHFYGYGSWQARIWFIGYEESGGDVPEDVAERINYFYRNHKSSAPALADIRDLYRHVSARADGPRATLFKTLYDYRFGSKAILHGAWKNLIAFAHGYKNKKVPDLSAYQKKSFVLLSAEQEALISLYPLPAPHNHAWYYSWLDLPGFRFLKSRTEYHDHVYASRINTILANISHFRPDIVVMYGMNNIEALKTSVQDIFPGAKFNRVKAIRQQIPQHHRAECNGTTLLITTQVPTLRHNRVETGFDWYLFGKLMSGK